MKDPKGNTRTRAICGWSDGGTYHQGLADVSGRITMASGTILPNQPIECYNAIRLLDWSAINCASLNEFRNTYYELGEGFIRGPHRVVLDDGTSVMRNELYWSDEVRNVPTNLADLQFRLRKHIMVRRTKEMVLPQLPPKQWHLFPITTTAAMRKALKHPGWKKAEKLDEMDPGAFKTSMPIDGAISTARRELGEAKMPAMLDYIKQLLSEGVEKLVVSAWHHAVLDFLREKLAPYGLVYMDGTTNTAKKQAAVDAFQRDTQTKIILGQMLPLGQGWTLTAAQDAVFCEPDWVPGVNDQMLDRLQRIGQEGSYVLGHIPVVADSMDERILGRAIEKDKSIYAALDSE
jgi:SNF2 family DNA or RNA helicase